VAWAAPSTDSSAANTSATSDGVGPGGIPEKGGSYLDSFTPSFNPSPGDPVPAGSIYSTVAKGPGNVPDALGVFMNNFWQVYGVETHYGRTAPGLDIKSFAPGCSHGHTVTEDGTANTGPLCH
jgi:hypothetical protein